MMNNFLLLLRLIVRAIAFGLPSSAWCLCASPPEAGRWRNVDPKADPAVIDVRMTGCGDQVLNGEQTKTSYRLRVWVLQSSGKYYGRPSVEARATRWKGETWMVGRVNTGGYVDHIWTNAVQSGGQRRLRVLIKHQSLDSKPSATSEHWFTFERRL
jgi:hypothetical protein